MWYTNIIAIKDIIVLEKTRKEVELLEDIANTTALAKVAWETRPIDLALK